MHPPAAAAVSRTPPPDLDRELGDTLRCIAEKSPKDLAALKVLAKMMLDRIESAPRSS